MENDPLKYLHIQLGNGMDPVPVIDMIQVSSPNVEQLNNLILDLINLKHFLLDVHGLADDLSKIIPHGDPMPSAGHRRELE